MVQGRNRRGDRCDHATVVAPVTPAVTSLEIDRGCDICQLIFSTNFNACCSLFWDLFCHQVLPRLLFFAKALVQLKKVENYSPNQLNS